MAKDGHLLYMIKRKVRSFCMALTDFLNIGKPLLYHLWLNCFAETLYVCMQSWEGNNHGADT